MSGGSRRDPCGAFSSSQREMSSVLPCLDDRNHRSRNGIFILKFIRYQLRILKMFSKLKDHLKEQVQHFVDSNNPLEPAHISPPASAYWKASMGPNVPVSQDWRQETGAHGWGNAELQDYTTDERNSCIRTVGSGAYALSIRAIIEPQRITSARLTSHQKLSRDKGYLTAKWVTLSLGCIYFIEG